MGEPVAQRTAERLKQAAWAVVRDEGVAAATSRRITEVAGANLAAITYHFGSKDALVGAAVLDQLRSWIEPLTVVLQSDDDDIAAHDAAVARAVDAILDRFATNNADIEAIVTLVLTSPELPGVREALANALRDLRAVAVAAMTRQQAAGLVPDTVTPAAMAAVFTAFAIGLVTQSRLDPEAPSIDLVVSEFLSLLVRPALPPPSKDGVPTPARPRRSR